MGGECGEWVCEGRLEEVVEVGWERDWEEFGEGPIATNNNPHCKERITMIPYSSWIKMDFVPVLLGSEEPETVVASLEFRDNDAAWDSGGSEAEMAVLVEGEE